MVDKTDEDGIQEVRVGAGAGVVDVEMEMGGGGTEMRMRMGERQVSYYGCWRRIHVC